MAADTVREECDERTGEYRENEAGEDRDPLQDLVSQGKLEQAEAMFAELEKVRPQDPEVEYRFGLVSA